MPQYQPSQPRTAYAGLPSLNPQQLRQRIADEAGGMVPQEVSLALEFLAMSQPLLTRTIITRDVDVHRIEMVDRELNGCHAAAYDQACQAIGVFINGYTKRVRQFEAQREKPTLPTHPGGAGR